MVMIGRSGRLAHGFRLPAASSAARYCCCGSPSISVKCPPTMIRPSAAISMARTLSLDAGAHDRRSPVVASTAASRSRIVDEAFQCSNDPPT
jgi:hypothetical protein